MLVLLPSKFMGCSLYFTERSDDETIFHISGVGITEFSLKQSVDELGGNRGSPTAILVLEIPNLTEHYYRELIQRLYLYKVLRIKKQEMCFTETVFGSQQVQATLTLELFSVFRSKNTHFGGPTFYLLGPNETSLSLHDVVGEHPIAII